MQLHDPIQLLHSSDEVRYLAAVTETLYLCNLLSIKSLHGFR